MRATAIGRIASPRRHPASYGDKPSRRDDRSQWGADLISPGRIARTLANARPVTIGPGGVAWSNLPPRRRRRSPQRACSRPLPVKPRRVPSTPMVPGLNGQRSSPTRPPQSGNYVLVNRVRAIGLPRLGVGEQTQAIVRAAARRRPYRRERAGQEQSTEGRATYAVRRGRAAPPRRCGARVLAEAIARTGWP